MSDHVERIRQQWRVERPDVDTEPVEVIGRLHRLGAILREALIAEYRNHDLGEGEFDVLATLRRSGPPFAMQPRELANQTMVTTGGMTKRLDRLEDAGLIERQRSNGDGRARVVALTTAGRKRIDVAFTAHMRNEAQLLEGVSAADRAALARILARWLERVEPGE